MRILSLFLISLLISPIGFSNDAVSFENALSIFNQRDSSEEGMEKARTASKIYLELFNTLTAPEKKAEAGLHYCIAQFFLGERTVDQDIKRSEFKLGFELADKAIDLIQKGRRKRPGKVKKKAWAKLLAKLYYWQPATVGRWGESVGASKVLFKWGLMRKRLKAIKKLKFEGVVGYGADRFLGRALYEMPGAFGDKEGAVRTLERAHNKTLHPELKISVFPLGDIYLADAYIAVGQSQEAKELLERMDDVLSVEGNPEILNNYYIEKFGGHRLVEIIEELSLAKERLGNL